MLLSKCENLLCSFNFLIKVIKLNLQHALLDFCTRLLFIGVVQVYDFVKLDAMTLQFIDVILSLWEPKKNETSNERSLPCCLVNFQNKLVNAQILKWYKLLL